MSLDSLWFFFDERGRYQEGEQIFARAAAAFSENSLSSITMRAKIQVRQGALCHNIDLLDKGNSLLRGCIAILRQVGAHADLALALRGLAVLLSDNNLAPNEVAEYLEESLAIFTEANDRWNHAHIFNRLSIFHHREFARRGVQEGSLERAEECALHCLALYQQLGSPWGTAAAYLNLSDVAYLRSEYEQCKEYAQKSLSFFSEFGNLWGVSCCYFLIGDAACKHGAYDESRWYTRQCLQLFVQFHFPTINFFSLFCLDTVIQIWLGEGEIEKAYQLMGLLYQQWQKAASNLKHHQAFSRLSRLEAELPPHLAEAVERGRVADAEAMVKSIIAEFSQSAASEAISLLPVQRPLTNILSERELEILQRVAEGCSNQEISDRLYIGVSTVKKHINHIYDKLDAKNRTQAVAFARERHLIGG
jgi:DNA-binding CsgD family transcriptional regulator/tetratricopeptide (TPR) repeat protein